MIEGWLILFIIMCISCLCPAIAGFILLKKPYLWAGGRPKEREDNK
jgi:hypothetical protein